MPDIAALLQSNSESDRKQAILLLAKDPTQENLKLLVNVARTDGSDALRELAKKALMLIKKKMEEQKAAKAGAASGEADDPPPPEKPAEPKPVETQAPASFKCEFCGQEFKTKTTLGMHQKNCADRKKQEGAVASATTVSARPSAPVSNNPLTKPVSGSKSKIGAIIISITVLVVIGLSVQYYLKTVERQREEEQAMLIEKQKEEAKILAAKKKKEDEEAAAKKKLEEEKALAAKKKAEEAAKQKIEEEKALALKKKEEENAPFVKIIECMKKLRFYFFAVLKDNQAPSGLQFITSMGEIQMLLSKKQPQYKVYNKIQELYDTLLPFHKENLKMLDAIKSKSFYNETPYVNRWMTMKLLVEVLLWEIEVLASKKE